MSENIESVKNKNDFPEYVERFCNFDFDEEEIDFLIFDNDD